MKKALLAVLLATLLVGCGEPKIDGSNEESMKTSIQKVRDSLSEEQKAQFDDALKVVVFSQLNMKQLMQAGAGSDPSSIKDKMRDSLAGKTGKEVIDYAEKIKKDRAEKEKEQALQEIEALEEKQKAANQNLEQLKAFKITKSKFYIRKDQFNINHPVIELSVENSTPKTASRLYFEGVITSPGREVPWFRGYSNVEIAGGIAPGEKANWKVEPNMFSEWGKINAPADAVLTVTVIRLDDAAGKPMFGDAWFTEEEASRLAGLKAKYQSH